MCCSPSGHVALSTKKLLPRTPKQSTKHAEASNMYNIEERESINISFR
jgi:hypothetical protein